MTVSGFRTAFFIDTDSRQLKLPSHSSIATYMTKTLLLILTVVMVACILEVDNLSISFDRRFYICVCALIFSLRVWIQMTFFWTRSIPWKEVIFESAGIIPLSFYTISSGARLAILEENGVTSTCASGYDVLGIACGYRSLLQTFASSVTDKELLACSCDMRAYYWVSFFLFIFGTWVNIWPEFQRYIWKRKSVNNGRLYTGSLFSYARHINYTGEVLSFIGLSLLTNNMFTLWVPLCMGAGMATFSIWEIEFYLEQKYAKEWMKYCEATPHVLVPGVY